MKKTLSAMISLVLVLLLAAGCSSSSKYDDGTYEGKAEGSESEVVVNVVVKSGKIDIIDVVKHEETESLMTGIIDDTIPEIIEKQTTEGVDSLSGASKSSEAVIQAVALALEQARR